MSQISEAFDSMSKEQRLQLLLELEFDDPMRYLAWEEPDLRYGCLFYEVQTELGHCFSRGEWSGIAAQSKTAKAPEHTPMHSTCLPEHMKAVAEGIKAVKLYISHS